MDGRIVRERVRMDEEQEILLEEIERTLGKLRDDKAVGVDEILRKVWRYGEKKLKEWTWKLCNRTGKAEWEG